jgi:micrococcal nuclease
MPRYRRSRLREALVAAVLLALAFLRWFSDDADRDATAGAGAGLHPGIYQIARVVDGDTLVVEGGRIRIRLQGVDTPETVKEGVPVQRWGPEASAFTKAFIADGQGRVRVEVDGESRDQHGRYLAFLWLGKRMLNEELVRQGLARATLQYDFSERKKEVLRAAQRDARRSAVGIWSDSDR